MVNEIVSFSCIPLSIRTNGISGEWTIPSKNLSVSMVKKALFI